MGFLDFIPIVGDAIEAVSSAKQARRQRRFQADQAATAHQTEVKDLRAAGLNPILSATGGSGAQAMQGAMAQTPNFSETISSAIQNKKQRDLMNAQIDNTNADTAKKQAETENANLIGVDLENTNDAKWGTGGQPGQQAAQFTASQSEAVQRILESRQRVESAKESTRKEKLLNDVLEQDPTLRRWVLSASQQEYETINRALDSARTPADVLKALKAIVR